MNIVYTLDNQAIGWLVVSLSSVIHYLPNEKKCCIWLLVSDDVTETDLNILKDYLQKNSNITLKIIWISDEFKDFFANFTSRIATATYFRLMIPDILEGEDKCLYLDTDVIACEDLSQLYETDISAYDLAGVRALGYIFHPWGNEKYAYEAGLDSLDGYINSGVLLMNLREMREKDFSRRAKIMMDEHHPSHDQDIINKICAGKVLHIEYRYNMQTSTTKWSTRKFSEHINVDDLQTARSNPAIIHFSGPNKPWDEPYGYYASRWWMECMTTPVYGSFLDHIKDNLLSDAIFSRENRTSWYDKELDWNRVCYAKKVIIYGAGPIAAEAICSLREQGIFPTFCVVSKKGKKEEWQGIPVYGLDDVSEEYSSSLFLIAARKMHQTEMRETLLERGLFNFLVFDENLLPNVLDPIETIVPYRKEKERMEFLSIRERFLQSSIKHPIKNNKIVFMSINGYSDHGKYITEELLKKTNKLDIVWLMDRQSVHAPNEVRTILRSEWDQVIYEMETAAVWIVDARIPEHIIKREGQIYIHTKHWSSITLKRFYFDEPIVASALNHQELWRKDFKRIDYLISGSDFDEEACRRGFQFNGDFLRVGSPRTDAMFCEEQCKRKIYEEYGLGEHIHTILYAPTYRFEISNETQAHKIYDVEMNYELIQRVLEERFGGEWVFVIRMHPSVASMVGQRNLSAGVVDASGYEDGEELASACDIMISDYSSIMFEPAFVGKPVFLYAPDRDSYIGKEYDFLIPYDDLPFPIATSNEELVSNIESFDETSYQQKVREFLNKYGVHEDGHASERAAKKILELMK